MQFSLRLTSTCVGFQGFKISFNKRKDIETLIGKKAEKLAWIFCVIDRLSVDNAVKNYCDAIMKSNLDMSAMLPVRCRSRLELGNFPVNFISNEEWFDFIELSLADWFVNRLLLPRDYFLSSDNYYRYY